MEISYYFLPPFFLAGGATNPLCRCIADAYSVSTTTVLRTVPVDLPLSSSTPADYYYLSGDEKSSRWEINNAGGRRAEGDLFTESRDGGAVTPKCGLHWASSLEYEIESTVPCCGLDSPRSSPGDAVAVGASTSKYHDRFLVMSSWR